MNFFINFAYSIAISHFEGCEVLDVSIEAIVEFLHIFSLAVIFDEKSILNFDLIHYFGLKFADLILGL